MHTVYSSINCVCAFSSFATLENSGLLFYNGRFNEKHDFIALEIQEGQVVLKYSTGTISLSLSISLCVTVLVCVVFHYLYRPYIPMGKDSFVLKDCI